MDATSQIESTWRPIHHEIDLEMGGQGLPLLEHGHWNWDAKVHFVSEDYYRIPGIEYQVDSKR